MFKRPAPQEDDVHESIIDAMDRTPVPFKGDFHIQPPSIPMVIDPKTTPMAHIPPNPPSRQDRQELHITPPMGQPRIPPPPGPPRLSARARVMASIETLPCFRDTARVMGWEVFIPPQRPRMTWQRAVQSIGFYTDKTHRLICNQVEAARGELWERHRDYDMVEAEHRAKYPLTNQVGM